MSSINEKYKNSIIDNKLNCTETELNEYINYGIIFKQGRTYYDRSFNKLEIKLPSNFNIDLTTIISSGLNAGKSKYCKRVFCMTNESFNKYKEMGFIIIKNDTPYFRIYNNEEWLVNII